MNRILRALEIVRLAKLLGDYDSNVIGMAAEVIAEERFDMRKAPPCTKAVDGYVEEDGQLRSMQVKGWSSKRIHTYRGNTFCRIPSEGCADLLLVVAFFCFSETYEVLYFGPTALAGEVDRAGRSRVVRLAGLMDGERLRAVLVRAEADVVENATDTGVEWTPSLEPARRPSGNPRSIAQQDCGARVQSDTAAGFGVYEVPCPRAATKRFRYGNHPVRQSELTREFGACNLRHLCATRTEAKLTAARMNNE